MHKTVDGLIRSLAESGHPVSPSTIYGWASGRHVPRPAIARLLVQVGCPPQALADLYVRAIAPGVHVNLKEPRR
jgi:hypothetical protein